MHRPTKKEYADQAVEGWFKYLVQKPAFKKLEKEWRVKLNSVKESYRREKILEEYSNLVAKKFNLRQRNFEPLLEEHLESGMIMLNPFELYGVSLRDKGKLMTLTVRPGIRKETLHRAINFWWPMIDAKMKAFEPAEHKKQFKERKTFERDLKIYELYEKGIIKYNGELKDHRKSSDLKKYGLTSVPGIDMRKKIIVRMKGYKI